MDARRWDAIVVGSGSSGGIVAARLAEDPARSVLLVEAGPDFPDVETAPPAWLTGGVWSGMVHEVDWGYLSEPLPSGRRLQAARGKLAGGSSMVNGTLCVRGRPEDFDGR